MIVESATSALASRDLLRQSAEWHLIGLLLGCPRGDWFARVAAVSQEVGDEQLRRAAELAQQEAGEGPYHTTFGPGGPAAPREVSCYDGILAGRILAELRTQYAAFGYAGPFEEAPDHVATEAGFVAYLRFKEAFARHCGAANEAEIAADAARNFLQTHLAVLAGRLAESLECSGIGYLSLAAAALHARLEVRCPAAVPT